MNDEWLLIDTPELAKLYSPSQVGDQVCDMDGARWLPKEPREAFLPVLTYRRLRSKSWLAVKDVPPQWPCWTATDDGHVVYRGKPSAVFGDTYYFWQPAPHAPPPPQEAWERAYERHATGATLGTVNDKVREAFKAGWEARGK